jgi:hypothetical protein
VKTLNQRVVKRGPPIGVEDGEIFDNAGVVGGWPGEGKDSVTEREEGKFVGRIEVVNEGFECGPADRQLGLHTAGGVDQDAD